MSFGLYFGLQKRRDTFKGLWLWKDLTGKRGMYIMAIKRLYNSHKVFGSLAFWYNNNPNY